MFRFLGKLYDLKENLNWENAVKGRPLQTAYVRYEGNSLLIYYCI
jgi:hypothetical protein